MLTRSTTLTAGSRFFTLRIPLDKLSLAPGDSIWSLSSSMGKCRFLFESEARFFEFFTWTDHENVLWPSGYICCWEQSSWWLRSILLRRTFTELVCWIKSSGFSGYHRLLATSTDRQLDTCGGERITTHCCFLLPSTDLASTSHLMEVGNHPLTGTPLEARSSRSTWVKWWPARWY